MKKPIKVLRGYILNRRRIENQKEMRRIAQEIHYAELKAFLKVICKCLKDYKKGGNMESQREWQDQEQRVEEQAKKSIPDLVSEIEASESEATE